jgi:hypothetical protein
MWEFGHASPENAQYFFRKRFKKLSQFFTGSYVRN